MASTGILPPPPFLATPGAPDVPWARWLRLFERFLLASGATELPAPRRRALLLHCLGTEGQRIFDALPPSTPQTKAEPTSAASGVTPTQDAAAAATETQDGTTGAPRPPDEYDVAVEMLSKHFAAPCNVRLQRHRFRERRQLQGEPITDFAVALRELAALCNFATQADENMCEQFVAGVTCPRLRERLLLEGDNLTFDRAVDTARLREQTQREAEAFANPVQQIQQQLRDSSARQSRRDDNCDNGTRLPGRRRFSCSRAYSAPSPDVNAADAVVPGPRRANACGNCAAAGCSPSKCPARGRTCFACGRRGHFKRACRSYRRGREGYSAEVHEIVPEEDAASVISILAVRSDKSTGVYVDVKVAPVTATTWVQTINFLVDTGSAVSIMGEHQFQSLFVNAIQLKSSHLTLLDFSRRKIPVLGSFHAIVSYKGKEAIVTFHVTPCGTSLLGLDAVQALGLRIMGDELRCLQMSTQECRELPAMSSGLPQSTTPKKSLGPPKFGMPPTLWTKFGHLFLPGLGLVRGVQHKVKMKTSSAPVAQKLRPLPFSVRQPVSDEIEKLLAADVIERVNASEWVSPIVAARKADGSIRLCVDLREPNKAIVADNFPLPHMEELLHALNGARCFSKVDLASAYYQVVLHPDSRDLTSFITHEGLFRFKRVCFGLASAPAAFQQIMTKILGGCKGVLCYLDDIIIFGKTASEHRQNLEQVLEQIAGAGLKLNEKCVFNTSELSFLGHRVSAEGIAPLQTKVDAIINAPAPKDAATLRSFLGLVEYYSKFVPRLAEEVEPMRRLLRKDVHFDWDDAAKQSFAGVKRLLASHTVLRMFDPTLPVIVATDASAYGLGAVLQQVEGSHVRTVAFASRTLTETERKYSAGEREALACLWACEKWHVYLWGRSFTLLTDHQALVALLSSRSTGQRPLRIARWTTRLLRYNFKIQYRSGAHNQVADALSRLPVPDTEGGFQVDEEVVSLVTSSVHRDNLHVATTEDAILRQVMHFVQSSWPTRKRLAAELTPYYEIRDELSVVDGLVLRTERIVVPAKLRDTFIQLAHESHPGIVKTKQRIREKYWWPCLDKHVEAAVRSCSVCQASDKSVKNWPAPLQPVPLPDRPWDKISIDIMGPFERAPADCRFVIVVVDYFSRWPEIAFCSDITSRTVINFLLAVFAREGYPTELVSDHGRQFTSSEFECFLADRGIKHFFSAVYHPQANGLVERFNRVLKSYIQLALLEQRPIKTTVTEYLGIYRATPHSATGISPAVLLHGRHIRTSLDVVGQPSADFGTHPARELRRLRRRVGEYQQRNKAYADKRRAAREPKFKVGAYVRVKRPVPGIKGTPSFGAPLKILKRVGRWSFHLEDGRTWNASQLSAVPHEAVHEETGARQELLREDMETDGSAGNTTARKPSSEAKNNTSQNIPTQEAAQSPKPRGSALPPRTPSPPRHPPTGTTTSGLGADRVHEPEVFHQPEEQPVPLRRSTRERRPPERLGDYVQ